MLAVVRTKPYFRIFFFFRKRGYEKKIFIKRHEWVTVDSWTVRYWNNDIRLIYVSGQNDKPLRKKSALF